MNLYEAMGNNCIVHVDHQGLIILEVLAIGGGIYTGYKILEAFYLAGKKMEAAEHGRPESVLGNPEALRRLNDVLPEIEALVDSIPNTSITGCDVVSTKDSIKDAIKAFRAAKKQQNIKDMASEFKNMKKGMESLGYKFVKNSNTAFGGYFRRPKGNTILPSPQKVNDSLKGMHL